MADGEERFRRYHETGADFIEEARSRAQEFLNEFARMGGSSQRQAQGAFDDMVEGSRRNTGLIVNSIRDEIATQLSLLGFATKQDLEDLERRLVARFSAMTASPPEAGGRAEKKAGPTGKAGAKGAGVKKGAAKKAGPATKASPGKKAPPAKKTQQAGPAQEAGPAEKATGEA
jgi:polyhydroxyalkanoate synthesis regulator phasin